jgi:hypothetical protein
MEIPVVLSLLHPKQVLVVVVPVVPAQTQLPGVKVGKVDLGCLPRSRELQLLMLLVVVARIALMQELLVVQVLAGRAVVQTLPLQVLQTPVPVVVVQTTPSVLLVAPAL